MNRDVEIPLSRILSTVALAAFMVAIGWGIGSYRAVDTVPRIEPFTNEQRQIAAELTPDRVRDRR